MLFVILYLMACMGKASTAPLDFVTSNGSQLVLNQAPFYFIGSDSYWLINYPDLVEPFFQKCNVYGLTVVRLWAFNSRMPYAWGQYDESQFQALDDIIATAGKHKIRLILALGNSWQSYRSPEDFLVMAGVSLENKTLLDFYTNSNVTALYMNHIRSVTNRKNTFNGLKYNEDPTIFLWNVLNEPRCPGCDSRGKAAALEWVSTMTAYLKTQAPNQLSSVGNEGFFSSSDNPSPSNPGTSFNPGPWATCDNGQWSQMSQIQSVDVTTAHVLGNQMELLPPNWTLCGVPCFFEFLSSYISSHKNASEVIRKPFILEEFNCLLSGSGYNEATRASMFRLVFEALLASQRTSGGLAGALFWSASLAEVWDDGYSIYLDDGISVLSPPPPPNPDQSPDPPQPPQPPFRATVTSDKGIVDDFRMETARAACASEVDAWWRPAFDPNNPLLLYSYLNLTVGLMVQAVIIEAAKELNG